MWLTRTRPGRRSLGRADRRAGTAAGPADRARADRSESTDVAPQCRTQRAVDELRRVLADLDDETDRAAHGLDGRLVHDDQVRSQSSSAVEDDVGLRLHLRRRGGQHHGERPDEGLMLRRRRGEKVNAAFDELEPDMRNSVEVLDAPSVRGRVTPTGMVVMRLRVPSLRHVIKGHRAAAAGARPSAALWRIRTLWTSRSWRRSSGHGCASTPGCRQPAGWLVHDSDSDPDPRVVAVFGAS